MINFNLGKLNFENIGQWPWAAKSIFILLVICIVMVLGYSSVIKPKYKHYEKLKKENHTLKQKFELKQHQSAGLQQYRTQLQIMKSKFNAMSLQLPLENEMSGVVEEISKTGSAAGLKFEFFAPQKEVVHDFYIELPIKIVVVGKYHQVDLFLKHISNLKQIVTMNNFILKHVPIKSNQEQVDIEQELIMDMIVKIYRYKP